ncbi:MAG TPA: acetamidase/formamidase family protein [Ktedonobacterales bacterium]|nr:acetamidase/formamidase family protein [Ktedonobacterales bacterium]
MVTHVIEPIREAIQGCFSPNLPPILTVDPGDRVRYRTLDASWGKVGNRDFHLDLPQFERVPERDAGLPLCGPIVIRGARPGDTLEVRIERIVPDRWGWTWAGPGYGTGDGLGLDEEVRVLWEIDAAHGIASDVSGLGVILPIRPFMGMMGNAPAAPGYHTPFPPRRVGGNMDCRELVAGSTLWLPVEVDGALFSIGDGHAAQGDGEVSRMAIECPMDQVELTFNLRRDLKLHLPQADTPAGYLTIGIGQTLDEAQKVALNGMLDHLQRITGFGRSHAMALATCVVQLRVTQIVNGIVGIHALLPPNAFTLVPE